MGLASIGMASGLRDIYWLKYTPIVGIKDIASMARNSFFVTGVIQSLTKSSSIEMEKFY
jgi:hypothetical protein